MTRPRAYIDGLGRPMDMAIDLSDADELPCQSRISLIHFSGKKISEIMSTGVRVIDGLLTVGQGQAGSVF